MKKFLLIFYFFIINLNSADKIHRSYTVDKNNKSNYFTLKFSGQTQEGKKFFETIINNLVRPSKDISNASDYIGYTLDIIFYFSQTALSIKKLDITIYADFIEGTNLIIPLFINNQQIKYARIIIKQKVGSCIKTNIVSFGILPGKIYELTPNIFGL